MGKIFVVTEELIFSEEHSEFNVLFVTETESIASDFCSAFDSSIRLNYIRKVTYSSVPFVDKL